MAYIEAKNLTKVYRSGDSEIRAIDNISFNIEKGEFVVILGPSGAGKSTTINILGGMDHATSGEYIIGGKNITTLKEKNLGKFRRTDIGFVFQFYNLIPTLTAKENVQLQEAACENQDHLEAVDALNAVGLGERLNNFPAQLSGGEQQRVAIARAIVKLPKLLLCDEPTGALDSKTGRNILKLLKKLAKEDNFTIMVVTHNQKIAKIANHLIRISDGKILSDEMVENPEEVDKIEW